MRTKYFLIAALIIVATVIATAAVYSDLPDQIPTHWNIRGEIDGYGGKPSAFLLPGVMAGIVLLFAALPWLSPRKFEVDTFRPTYLYMMIVIVAFMAYIQALTLWAALSKPVDMNRAIMGALFLLFVLFGRVLGRVQRNFYIGIRTPWTLADERVWRATHHFAAKVFVTAGLLGLLCVALGAGMAIEFGILITAALASVIYSLVYYKRLEQGNDL
jgi:uncharacterized membrane protein